jgi:hypothetical protein
MGNTVARSDSNGLNLLLERIYQDGGYDFRDHSKIRTTQGVRDE